MLRDEDEDDEPNNEKSPNGIDVRDDTGLEGERRCGEARRLLFLNRWSDRENDNLMD